MFNRSLTPTLTKRIQQFPIIALVGPRQSGKTTLLRHNYPDYDYINLELPDTLNLIKADPRSLLEKKRPHGLIIDEAQQYPALFSYIQVISDETQKKGQFILSGSQNFLLNAQITQSLAGRVAMLELLPLTYPEYLTNKKMPAADVWTWLFNGSYPRPYQDHIAIRDWLGSHIQTYIERDVRSLLNIRDIKQFQLFLKLCAGRHGQLLNISELASDCGIATKTAHHWLNILEASYIIFRLPPYFKNFSKRLIKSHKLYFYDSSIVCYLLGIETPDHLSIHAARGAIFEGYVISELKKHFLNQGESKDLYFWRDSNGIEIDCLFEQGGTLNAIEIKSTKTFQASLLKNLNRWEKSIDIPHQTYLVYTGEAHDILNTQIVSWNNIDTLLTQA